MTLLLDPATVPVTTAPRRSTGLPRILLPLVGLGGILLGPVDGPPWWLAVRTAATLGLLLVLPTTLLARRLRWQLSGGPERLLLSGGAALLACLVIGVAWNWLGPLLGVDAPLERVPLLVVAVVANLALWSWRRPPNAATGIGNFGPLSVTEQGVVALAILDVLVAVGGAIRLNNGYGGVLAGIALCLGVALVVAIVGLQDVLRESVVLAGLYGLGLALLLALSMRGWYVTGHDIQSEFRLAAETARRGLWTPGEPSNAYNACVSVTVLPAVVAKLSGLPVLWVFKVVIQLVFGLVVVVVRRIALGLVGRRLAALAAVYFVIFPTYLGDLPYLNRQEIALVFVALIVLVVVRISTDVRGRDSRTALAGRRRWAMRWTAALSVGVVLSHYSTNYVLLGTLLVAAVPCLLLRLLLRRATPEDGALLRAPIVANLPFVLCLTGLTLLWTVPVTSSGGQLARTSSGVVDFLRGSDTGPGSSDTGHSLVSVGPTLTEQQRLDRYASEVSSQSRPDILYPASAVERYPIVVAPDPPLPLTATGRVLQSVGVPVPSLVAASRAGAALWFQGMVLLGCLLLLWRRNRVGLPGEYLAIVGASVLVIGIQIVLPALTVDYGLLRAFQQSLLVFAPVIALAAHLVLRRVVGRWAWHVQLAVVAGMAASLTGLLPQLVGGYAAQPHLANRGTAHDLYSFPHGEVVGLRWVQEQHVSGAAPDVAMDRFTFRLQESLAALDGTPGIAAASDLFPTALHRDALVVLGPATVERGVSTIFYTGDLITYRYPVGLLEESKDLVYSNGSIAVFR